MFVNSERLIDLSYYINIARSLSTTLTEVGIPFEIELHSEVLEKDTIVEPDDPAFKGRISESIPASGGAKPLSGVRNISKLEKIHQRAGHYLH